MSELARLTIHEANQKIKSGTISVTELTQAVLNKIDQLDPRLGCYITVCREQALCRAREIDNQIAKGSPVKTLTGIPIAPKDIYLTRGIRTTCASNILRDFVPTYNATVIDRLLEQGAILIGKTNLDEFAMGSSTENSCFHCTKNPWDLSRVPGGSSGGSAAAVSAHLCIASTGTDTGGSIRQPAAHCSVVGLKPTYGRVSRYGTVAYASSLDQMGPITKDVEDAAIMLNTIAGKDSKDSTSIDRPVPDYTLSLGRGIQGLKIGIPREFFDSAINADVRTTVETAMRQLEALGAKIIEITLPHTKYVVATYYIIAPAEASANLARYDGVRFGLRKKSADLHDMYTQTKSHGFGAEVQRRILAGTYVLSSGYYDAYYISAQKARTLIRNDYLAAFDTVDIIAGPVAPTTAFKLGEMTNDPLKMYLSDILTLAVNLSGLPAMSIPCGFGDHNLPVGLQLIGKPFDEETLIRTAHAYEQSTEWHRISPELG
ncbi:MAG: Asp-tRNA(Asn)/Glu-tRNA(Gln) amidotransferase subunit GatA [Deltaproteobacteria bacterium]|nr:Asp-tRNA(Asn)/Glu-tRNA(Gln) amidotransferase subunit GatA [Deltaproteobacteria bacterium]